MASHCLLPFSYIWQLWLNRHLIYTTKAKLVDSGLFVFHSIGFFLKCRAFEHSSVESRIRKGISLGLHIWKAT